MRLGKFAVGIEDTFGYVSILRDRFMWIFYKDPSKCGFSYWCWQIKCFHTYGWRWKGSSYRLISTFNSFVSYVFWGVARTISYSQYGSFLHMRKWSDSQSWILLWAANQTTSSAFHQELHDFWMTKHSYLLWQFHQQQEKLVTLQMWVVLRVKKFHKIRKLHFDRARAAYQQKCTFKRGRLLGFLHIRW